MDTAKATRRGWGVGRGEGGAVALLCQHDHQGGEQRHFRQACLQIELALPYYRCSDVGPGVLLQRGVWTVGSYQCEPEPWFSLIGWVGAFTSVTLGLPSRPVA